jgi:hypothetical protein
MGWTSGRYSVDLLGCTHATTVQVFMALGLVGFTVKRATDCPLMMIDGGVVANSLKALLLEDVLP